MRLDIHTLFLIWGLSSIPYGVWYAVWMFRGGENSRYINSIKKKVAFAAVPMWMIQVGAVTSLFVNAVLWPYSLFMYLRSKSKYDKTQHLLFLHPTLAKLRAKMAGRESEYAAVFAEFELDILTKAIEAIDLDSITPAHAPSEGALTKLTYTDIVEGALTYTQLDAYAYSLRRSEMEKAQTIGRELARRFGPFRAVIDTASLLIVGHVHGWLPEGSFNRIKTWYASHLLDQYNNADHLYDVFKGITAKTADNIKQVRPKKADMTPEEHARALSEYNQQNDPKRQSEISETSD